MKKIFYTPIILFGSWYLLFVGVMEYPWLNVFQVCFGYGLGGLTIIAGIICLTGTASDLRANKRRKISLLLLSVCYFIFIFLFSRNLFHCLQDEMFYDSDRYRYYLILDSYDLHDYERSYHLVYITCLLPIYYLILLVIMVKKDSTISSTIEKIPEPSEIKKEGGPHGETEHDSKLLGTLKTGLTRNGETPPPGPQSVSEWICPRCETINHVTDESCKVCGHRRI